MSHIMTITDGVPSFTCTEASDAECHHYPACECDYYDDEHDANHPKVQHEECWLALWYGIDPTTTQDMFIEDDDSMPRDATGEIEIEWNESPMWRFVSVRESHGGGCDGSGQCKAHVHVHGCFTPHLASECDAPDEHGHIPEPHDDRTPGGSK